MSFEAEMLVPREAIDDLGQQARASITFLRYSLQLGYQETGDSLTPGSLKIMEEELVHISQRDALRHLLFPHSVKNWRESVVLGRRTNAPFISTQAENGNRIIYLHQDGGAGGPVAQTGGQLAAYGSIGGQCWRVSPTAYWWRGGKWRRGECCNWNPPPCRRAG